MMQTFRSHIRQTVVYFIGVSVFFLAGNYLFFHFGKADSFKWLNQHHGVIADSFFPYYTNVGNGVFAIALAFIFLWKKKVEICLMLIYSFLLSGLIAQIIKNLTHYPRPISFFGNTAQQYFIQGLTFHTSNSFPSGHTATAFAMAAVLSFMIPNKKWQAFFVIAASAVGFSRIYTGQHFLNDVLVGAIIGTVCGIICVYTIMDCSWARHEWLHKLVQKK
jgi:membrane-associated phospholipid phosphatase